MTIYDKSGDPFLEITPDDASYRHREVMGDDTLTLKFSLAEHVEIPVGSTCEFGGETYTLARPEALTMRHSRDFEYTVTMEGPQYRAGMWKLRDLSDGRLSFPLTAKPEEHLKLLIDNLNDREGSEVWTAGGCIDGVEVCVSYDHVYCREALDLMAEAFGTEWEIDGAAHTVSLGKVEHGRDDPIALSYGKGSGFLPDVGRSNSSDTPPCEILYAQGGGDNIDMSKYPQELHRGGNEGGTDPKTGEPYPGDGTGNSQNTYSSVLLLPPGRVIGYDGGEFLYEGDEGWDGEGVRHYVVDDRGYSIRRDPDEKPLDTMAEDSLDCSDIYPKRVGTVAEVHEVENTDGDVPFYDFTDPEIDFDYNDYIVGTGPLTVIFQSGNLAGREFDVTYVHADRRFEVVQQEIDGVIMPQGPGEAFGINPGDTYAVFGCMLPDAYICHDGDHSGAEWDMLRECAAYMYEHEQENPTITGKMDAIWAKGRWEDIGPRVRPGGFVRFADRQWQNEALLIRITGVKDYLNSPCSPELELSNETRGTGLWTGLRWISMKDMELSRDIDSSALKASRAIVGATAGLEVEISDVSDRVAAVDRDLSGRMDAINESLTDTQDAVSGVEDKVSSLEGSVTDLEGAVSKVADYAADTRAATEAEVAGLTAAIKELQDAVKAISPGTLPTEQVTLTVRVSDEGGDEVDARIEVEADSGAVYEATGSEAEFKLEGGATVTVTVSADGYGTFSQTLTVTGDTTLSVTLHEASKRLTLDPTSLVVDAAGGRMEVDVDSSSSCQATADVTWISNFDTSSGDTLSFDVEANTSGSLRVGTVTVTNEDGLSASLLVVQEGE